jgi:hypothetical protein
MSNSRKIGSGGDYAVFINPLGCGYLGGRARLDGYRPG